MNISSNDLHLTPEQLLADHFIRPSLRGKLYTLDLRRTEPQFRRFCSLATSLACFFDLPVLRNVHTNAYHTYRFTCFIVKNLALDALPAYRSID